MATRVEGRTNGDRPSANPPVQQTAYSSTATAARPTMEPPAAEAVLAAGTDVASDERPALPLPGLSMVTAAAAAGTVWMNNQKISSLWSINQDRNAFAGVANVGWVKLSIASDTGIMALTKLASHAYQMKSIVNYRVEADGMIHEMYIW